MFIVWWLVWIAVVILVSAGLALAFPKHQEVHLLAQALLFVFPGFWAGSGRDSPGVQGQVRFRVLRLAAVLLIVLLVVFIGLYEVANERGDARVAPAVVGMLAGFCMGRLARRRRSNQPTS